MTLILIASNGQRAEYKILTCEYVLKSYIQDLYNLYIGKFINQAHELVQSATAIYVENVIHPKEWLNCIKWSRAQNMNNESSLELFVARSKNSSFYYAVGPSGNVLMNSNNDVLKIHNSTVEILSGNIKYICKNPKIICIEDE